MTHEDSFCLCLEIKIIWTKPISLNEKFPSLMYNSVVKYEMLFVMEN